MLDINVGRCENSICTTCFSSVDLHQLQLVFFFLFFLCLAFFSSPFSHFHLFSHISMHCSSLDELEASDLASLQPYGVINLSLDEGNFGDYAADPQLSRPLLRSRPGINFYASPPWYPSSHNSGSMLHSNLNFSLLLARLPPWHHHLSLLDLPLR